MSYLSKIIQYADKTQRGKIKSVKYKFLYSREASIEFGAHVIHRTAAKIPALIANSDSPIILDNNFTLNSPIVKDRLMRRITRENMNR